MVLMRSTTYVLAIRYDLTSVPCFRPQRRQPLTPAPRAARPEWAWLPTGLTELRLRGFLRCSVNSRLFFVDMGGMVI